MTDYPWPDGKAAALCVTFDLDGESPHLWRTRHDRPAGVAELEQRRYGPRRGVEHLLAMLRRLEISSTFFVPGWIAREYPDVVRAVHADGHEIGLHGWLHEPPTDLAATELEDTLLRSADQIEAVTGVRPTGYRSPSWQMSLETFGVLDRIGVVYDSSLMGDDRPYTVDGLCEIPVDWATDDAPYYRYVSGDARPPAFATALVDAWRHEIVSARRLGTLCMLTMHPFLSGRPARVSALEDMLGAVIDDRLLVGRVDALAQHHSTLDGTERSTSHTLVWPNGE